MRTLCSPAAFLALVFFASTPLFSQSSNGTISGTVADASGAIVPGVMVTATNNATGVVSTALSNDAGVYNFASLLPGTYKVSASIPGFQTRTFNDVQLGNAGQLRINITIQPFMWTILLLGSVTLLLIVFQTLKTAITNPVKSLRTE